MPLEVTHRDVGRMISSAFATGHGIVTIFSRLFQLNHG
jgi:hypothetical protein